MLLELKETLSAKKKTRTQQKKKKEKQKENTNRRLSRIVKGWSAPKSNPKTGPLPVCQGCQQKITRSEMRVRNNHQLEHHHEFLTVHQFHVRTSCLLNQPFDQLELFLKKKWTPKNLQIIQNVIKKIGPVESDVESE